MAIRILIADDHRILRAGLKTLLGVDPNLEVAGEATTGEEALRAALELQPDIVLLDISMPGPGGVETIRRLKETAPNVRVLVLTMHEDSAMIQEYLRVGAAGYITKRAAETELVDAIYAVWRGMIYLHPSLMKTLVAPPPRPEPGQPSGEPLTPRELDILRLIVHGNTNRQIADKLTISVRTVETHRSNIMEKLNLRSRADLVRYAAEHGLVKLDDA